jgi:hypothetical protein
MARQVRQTLPDPPPEYDQQYVASLARSVNNYMGQAQALAEVIAARFIMTDAIKIPPGPPVIPGGPPDGLPDTSGLPAGLVYLKLVPALFAVNVVSATPAPTSSTTPVMMGLAMQFQTTYTKTGIFTLNGQVGNTGNGTTTLNVSYGNGTPPVNGAAFTGTLVGQQVVYKGPSAGAYVPFSQTILLSTITPGVPHWIDVVVSVSSNSSIVRDVEFVGHGLRDSSDYFLTVVNATDVL